MKTTRIILALAAVALLGLLAGCSSDDVASAPGVTASDNYELLDFNDPYGGLSETDEAVAFDDEGLKALLALEEEDDIEDPVARDPFVLRMEERSRHRERLAPEERPSFTFARLTWGMLRGPEDTTAVEGPCDMTDWTGTLRVDRGALVVRRTISFETPADHVIFPRLDRLTVAFISQTWCGFDGLVIEIVEHPVAEDDSVSAPNMLHIDTPGFQGSFPVAELADMDEVFEVDAAGNRFRINGFTVEDIDVCPKGFLSGRYRIMNHDVPDSVETGDHGERLGSFAGAWYGLHGRIEGFMRGGYGIDAEGNRVFLGKFINRQGRFRGLIRGGWEPAEREGELASYRGEWVTRHGQVEGVLGGEAHPVEGYPGGFYVGKWTTTCDAEASAEVLE